jgi:hypothetical protein
MNRFARLGDQSGRLESGSGRHGLSARGRPIIDKDSALHKQTLERRPEELLYQFWQLLTANCLSQFIFRSEAVAPEFAGHRYVVQQDRRKTLPLSRHYPSVSHIIRHFLLQDCRGTGKSGVFRLVLQKAAQFWHVVDFHSSPIEQWRRRMTFVSLNPFSLKISSCRR